MNVNERDEIAASVAAHAELGSRYDNAVAEGLVERIGEEIDKRIDARVGGKPRPAAPAPPPAPVMPATAMPPAEPRRGNGLSGMILGLGSMGLGVGATSVVVSHHVQSVAALLMVLLIWGAILGINIAHAQRKF